MKTVGVLQCTGVGVVSCITCSSDENNVCVLQCTRGGCDWAFTTAYKLKRHEESHEGNKDYYVSVCVLQCTRGGCDWAFTTAYKLKRHEESHEGKKDYYVSIYRILSSINNNCSIMVQSIHLLLK